jgi:hypothetical protein
MKERSSGLHGRVTTAGEAARQHLTPSKETLVRSILITVAAACAVAIPATALAAHGADDGASTTTSSTPTTTATTPTTTTTPSTPSTSRRLTAAQRARAIAAAREVVPASARVVNVEAERHAGGRRGYEVKLRTSTTRYEVDLTGAFRVVDVDRDRIGGDDDDGDDDHGGSGRDHPEDD